MRRTFPALLVMAFAIIPSGFTESFKMLTFRLLHAPVTSNIVNNPEEWSISRKTLGDCINGNVFACSLSINSSRTSYFHAKGKDIILNTFEYANAQTPKQDYLVITEKTSGTHIERIIFTISPMHYNGNAYERIFLGTDLGFKNGKD